MFKVWLITGASRGLGRALAAAVLDAGDKLIATARNPAQLSGLVERYGNQVRAVPLDVTDARAASSGWASESRIENRLALVDAEDARTPITCVLNSSRA
jgi:NAD(P)-dependent dehydrogenase (short-subunit alcohol dehydrogenase family)